MASLSWEQWGDGAEGGALREEEDEGEGEDVEGEQLTRTLVPPSARPRHDIFSRLTTGKDTLWKEREREEKERDRAREGRKREEEREREEKERKRERVEGKRQSKNGDKKNT